MKKIVLNLDCLGSSATDDDLDRFVSFLRERGYDVTVGINENTSAIDDCDWDSLMSECFNS